MKSWGYAKGWSHETREDITEQINHLIEAGAEQVVLEYKHVNPKQKSPINKLFEMAQPGDTIIVFSLSRICRSAHHLCEVVKCLQVKRLRLLAIHGITIDFRSEQPDPVSTAYLDMTQVLFEIEAAEAFHQDTERPKSQSLHSGIGRPRTTIDDIPAQFMQFLPLHLDGKLNISQLARLCSLSRPTVYKYMRLLDIQE